MIADQMINRWRLKKLRLEKKLQKTWEILGNPRNAEGI